MPKKTNGKEFIEKARKIHGDKYDYSKVEYISASTKVCIICPEHGEFWQTPTRHLSGYGCHECAKEKMKKSLRLSNDEFIERAKSIHGEKYDYSKTQYVDYKTKVCIICPEHGEFWQSPEKHLKGRGCRKCFNQKLGDSSRFTIADFVNRAKEVHGDKYDYSKVKYNGSNEKVCIICPKHGEFWQTPLVHINNKCGCKECRREKMHDKFKSTKEDFVRKAQKIHNNKYDYSKVEYFNSHVPVTIICPEHGEFTQKPYAHLNGHGCPVCKESKLEKEVLNFLIDRKITFEREKTFSWLKFNSNMFLDFYLPEHKIVIECQGEQHFSPVSWSGGNSVENDFLLIKERDRKKKELCEKNGLKIFYYFHNNYFLDKTIYSDKNIIKNLNDIRL